MNIHEDLTNKEVQTENFSDFVHLAYIHSWKHLKYGVDGCMCRKIYTVCTYILEHLHPFFSRDDYYCLLVGDKS